MSPRRFIVQTVSGYRTDATSSRKQPPGLSASVHDRLNLYLPVGSWQSETRIGFGGENIGVTGAIEAATALAERLNRDTA